jgi:hypothetical protein
MDSAATSPASPSISIRAAASLADVGICFLPDDFARCEGRAGWPRALDDRRRRGPTMALYVIANPEASGHLVGRLFLAELGRRLPKGAVARRKNH